MTTTPIRSPEGVDESVEQAAAFMRADRADDCHDVLQPMRGEFGWDAHRIVRGVPMPGWISSGCRVGK